MKCSRNNNSSQHPTTRSILFVFVSLTVLFAGEALAQSGNSITSTIPSTRNGKRKRLIMPTSESPISQKALNLTNTRRTDIRYALIWAARPGHRAVMGSPIFTILHMRQIPRPMELPPLPMI